MIDYETWCRMKQYQQAGLNVRQIAKHLELDPRTVENWLEEKQYRQRKPSQQVSKLDPYKLDPYKEDIVTSLLYHGFGIRGYYYVNSDYMEGQILFRIKHDFWKLDCPDCKGQDFIRKGTVIRRFKALPIGRKEVFIELPVQRIKCLCCQRVRQVKLDFAKEKCSYTRSFERYAVDLCRILPISDVAKLKTEESNNRT